VTRRGRHGGGDAEDTKTYTGADGLTGSVAAARWFVGLTRTNRDATRTNRDATREMIPGSLTHFNTRRGVESMS
jgi:hypothetical protein